MVIMQGFFLLTRSAVNSFHLDSSHTCHCNRNHTKFFSMLRFLWNDKDAGYLFQINLQTMNVTKLPNNIPFSHNLFSINGTFVIP